MCTKTLVDRGTVPQWIACGFPPCDSGRPAPRESLPQRKCHPRAAARRRAAYIPCCLLRGRAARPLCPAAALRPSCSLTSPLSLLSLFSFSPLLSSLLSLSFLGDARDPGRQVAGRHAGRNGAPECGTDRSGAPAPVRGARV